MSSITARPCPGKGPRFRSCPNLIRGNTRLCPECEALVKADNKNYDQKRLADDSGRRFWLSAAGRSIQKAKLNRDPLCERHLKIDREVPAVLVHHKDNDELNSSPENLESLCNECHEKEHGPNRWGRKLHSGVVND